MNRKICLLLILIVFAGIKIYGQANLNIVLDNNFSSFIQTNIPAFVGNDVTRTLVIRNTGTAPYSGRIKYKDIFGSALTVQNVTVRFNGPGPAPVIKWVSTSSTILSTPTNNTDYYLEIQNLPTSQGSVLNDLIIDRTVRLTDCIPAGQTDPGTSKVYLDYCDLSNSNCISVGSSTENNDTKLKQTIIRATYDYIQLADLSSTGRSYCSYKGGSEGNDKISFVLRLKNLSSGEIIHNVKLKMVSNGQEAIPYNTFTIKKCTFNPTTNAYTVVSGDLKETFKINNSYQKRTNINCVSEAIENLDMTIPTLTSSDFYMVSFEELNCCPDVTQPGVLQYNWDLLISGYGDCAEDLSAAHALTYTDTDGQPFTGFVNEDVSRGYIGNFGWGLTGHAFNGGEYVKSDPTYTERVSVMMADINQPSYANIGNNRITNSFMVAQYSFLGTSYSDGFNFDENNSELVIVIRTESGLHYSSFDGSGNNLTGMYNLSATGARQDAFRHIQFRYRDQNNNLLTWDPVTINGIQNSNLTGLNLNSTAYFNIPTTTTGYNLNESRAFAFNISDVYSIMNVDLSPGIPQYLSRSYKLSALRNFINSSELAFALESNCGESRMQNHIQDESAYIVEMYLVPTNNQSCSCAWQIFNITKEAKIMCPGCMFPGGAGRSCTVNRVTYGLKDDNDNGVADLTGVPLTDADVNSKNTDADPDNNILTNFGIYGDKLRVNTSYYLTGSESCNGKVFDDMMIGALRYSLLSVNIPNFGSFFSLDGSKGLKVAITRGTTIYSYTISGQSQIASLLSHPSPDIYNFDLSLDKLAPFKDASSPALPADFRYQSFDNVQLEFYLDIVNNQEFPDPYEEVGFINKPYFASVPISQIVRDFPQFSCVNGSPVVMDLNGNVVETIPAPPFSSSNGGPNYTNTLLLCEGYESLFNLVGIYNYHHTATFTRSEDKNCEKEQDVYNRISIGQNAKKFFKNEFRSVPLINNFTVITPDGYDIDNIYVSESGSDVLDVWAGSGTKDGVEVQYFKNQLGAGTHIQNGLEGYTKYSLDLTKIYKIDAEGIPYQTGTLKQRDEVILYGMSFTNRAVCNQLNGQPYVKACFFGNDTWKPSVTFDNYDSDLTNDTYVIPTETYYGTPEDGLTGVTTQSGIIALSQQSFSIDYILKNNSTVTIAENPYITLLYDPSQFANMTVCGSNYGITSQDPSYCKPVYTEQVGNLIRVVYYVVPYYVPSYLNNQLGYGREYLMHIKGDLIACADITNPASFTIEYGWNCQGVPVAGTELSSFCSNKTHIVQIYTQQASLIHSVSTTSTVCRTKHIVSSLTSAGATAKDLVYNLSIPSGITLNQSTVSVTYGSQTYLLNSGDGKLSLTSNGSIYQLRIDNSIFDNNPFKGAIDNIPGTNLITLEFDIFLANCADFKSSYSVNIAPTANSFCGTSISIPSYAVSDIFTSCFSVSLPSVPTQCSGSVFNVTASGSPSTYGPFTFDWFNVNDPGKLLLEKTNSYSSLFSATVTSNQTIQVTVTDKDGCKGVSTTDLNVFPITTPVIIGLNDHYCSGNISVPLKGSPEGGIFTLNGLQITSFIPDKAGVYTITYTVQDNNRCTVSTSQTVTVNPTPIVTIPDSYGVCPSVNNTPECIDLEASTTDGTPVYTYSWTVSGSSTVIGSSSKINVCPNSTTNYTINVTDTKGCATSANTKVIVDYLYTTKVSPTNYVCGSSSKICVTLLAKRNVSPGVIGMDYGLKYDKNAFGLASTLADIKASIGPVVKGNNPNPSISPEVDMYNDVANGIVHLSIYYKSGTPSGTEFKGFGDVVTLCFNVIGTPAVGSVFEFKPWELQEAYTLFEKEPCYTFESLTIIADPIYRGVVKYMNTNNNLASTILVKPFNIPVPNKETEIYATDNNCSPIVSSRVVTDLNGIFKVNISNGNNIKIYRDILNTYKPTLGTAPNPTFSFMRYVNGFDAAYVSKITTLSPLTVNNSQLITNASLQPIGLQMVAADVNMNGRVRSNDITLMQQRTVHLIDEYPQVWNYNTTTNKPLGNGLSLDWRFIDHTSYMADPQFFISNNYTQNLGGTNNGFYRDHSPSIPMCLAVKPQCSNSVAEVYHAILLGDVINGGKQPNGSTIDPNTGYYSYTYPANGDPNVRLASTTILPSITIDLGNAQYIGDNTYRLAVKYQSVENDTLVSFDLAMNYDEEKLNLTNVAQHSGFSNDYVSMAWNDIDDSQLMLTSFTDGKMAESGIAYYLDIRKAQGGKILPKELGSTLGLLNGYEVNVTIDSLAKVTSVDDPNAVSSFPFLKVVPNPAKGDSKIEFAIVNGSETNRITIVNTLGQIVREYNNLPESGMIDFTTEGLPEGVYTCVAYGSYGYKLTEKFVIAK